MTSVNTHITLPTSTVERPQKCAPRRPAVPGLLAAAVILCGVFPAVPLWLSDPVKRVNSRGWTKKTKNSLQTLFQFMESLAKMWIFTLCPERTHQCVRAADTRAGTSAGPGGADKLPTREALLRLPGWPGLRAAQSRSLFCTFFDKKMLLIKQNPFNFLCLCSVITRWEWEHQLLRDRHSLEPHWDGRVSCRLRVAGWA